MKVEVKLNKVENLLGTYIVVKGKRKYRAHYIEVVKNNNEYHLSFFDQIGKNKFTLPKHGVAMEENYLLSIISTHISNCEICNEIVEFHNDINGVWVC